MGDSADAPGLRDGSGRGSVDVVVLPHANGALSLCLPELIGKIMQTYGGRHPLCLVRDDQTPLVEGAGQRIVAPR
jgi:dipeptidase E